MQKMQSSKNLSLELQKEIESIHNDVHDWRLVLDESRAHQFDDAVKTIEELDRHSSDVEREIIKLRELLSATQNELRSFDERETEWKANVLVLQDQAQYLPNEIRELKNKYTAEEQKLLKAYNDLRDRYASAVNRGRDYDRTLNAFTKTTGLKISKAGSMEVKKSRKCAGNPMDLCFR